MSKPTEVESNMEQPPQIRRASSLGGKARDGFSSGLELRLPRSLSDPFANPLEVWRDERYRKSKRIRPAENGDDHQDEAGAEGVSSSSSISDSSSSDEKPRIKAWNTGSMLVRPKADKKSERVAQMTYVYLVGRPSTDVELVISPADPLSGSNGKELSETDGKKDAVLRTILSTETRACVPEHKTFSVRNRSKHKTAVIFWASLNEEALAGDVNEEEEAKGPMEEE